MVIKTDIQLLKQRRSKIVATIGPASNDRETIGALIHQGVDVFRLNMSHGDQAGHAAVYQLIREAARDAGRPIAILADLCGPKIRVGHFPDGGIDLAEGESVVVTVRDVDGGPGLIPSQYAALANDVEIGARVLLADGVMELRVTAIEGTEVICEVVQGGRLTDRKGINLPDVEVSAPSLTEKDRADAQFALDLGVDYLALSFVRSRADLDELRMLVDAHAHRPGLVAKIERPEALTEIDGILEASDIIMVARGDLGVEMPPEQVPAIQQQLIDRARRYSRPVIIATQMLESMIENARPTRAEVTDVSHSVVIGADAVMLSAETAAGAFPLEAVAMMDRVARQAEAHLWRQEAFGSLALSAGDVSPDAFGDAVARAMASLSRDLKVRAVVVFSESGMSATTMSGARPAAPVIAVSSNATTCCRLAVCWGVLPVEVDVDDLEDRAALARELAREMGLAAPGEFILTVQGFHADPERSTPNITLLAT
ncbi:MAG: pyruvate kinase [Pseudomonadota bacterium]